MHPDNIDETPVAARRVYSGGIINVEQWDVLLPDGKPAKRDIVLHIGAAAVIPMDERMRVLTVIQYRAAVGKRVLEIPAGKLDHPGEDPFACAQRELKEETGFSADKWTPLGSILTTVGFCNERIHLYLAQSLHSGDVSLDEDEFLAAQWRPLDALLEDALTGRIEDAKTLCAILLAARKLGI